MYQQLPSAQTCFQYANELNLKIQDLEHKRDTIGLTSRELLELRHTQVMHDWHIEYGNKLLRKANTENEAK